VDQLEDDGSLNRVQCRRIAAIALILSSALLVACSALALQVRSMAVVWLTGVGSLAVGVVAW